MSFQVSVLGTPSPAVTPTKLLYNVLATPSPFTATGDKGKPAGRSLAEERLRQLLPGSLPGVIVGSIVSVQLLPGPLAFHAIIAVVLIPSVGPDWAVGLALVAGGIVGGYCGARIQPRLPVDMIRRLLGGPVAAIGLRYAWLAARP